MLLEDSVCLFVNYGGPKLGKLPFYCLQSIPPHFFFVGVASGVLVFLLSTISIVSDLISNAASLSLVILMDLGKRRDECYNVVDSWQNQLC